MKPETFKCLWTRWSKSWHENAKVKVGEGQFQVSELCEINYDIWLDLWDCYEKTKENVKKMYFFEDDKLLNKYKRAAVLSLVINGASPLIYKERKYIELFGEQAVKIPDRLFLKQRLSFYISLCSILMEYDKDAVNELETPIFHYPQLTESEKNYIEKGRKVDDFLTSIYKDMFYSEIYHNCNVLTLSNVFWLIAESSGLSNITPLEPSND